jgi:sugar phosphate isomerase/epimerase
MIDTLHFSRSGCSLSELEEIPLDCFHFVQISDAAGPVPETTEGLIFTAREDRLNPGDGELDLAAILSRLPANIPVSVEIPNSSLAKVMPAVDRVRAARLATLKLLSEVERLRLATRPHAKSSPAR